MPANKVTSFTARPNNGLVEIAGRQYPDPFVTFANSMLPQTMGDILEWAEAIWINNGTYAAAMKRIASYFITKVLVKDAVKEDRDQFEQFLQEFQVNTKLLALGIDFLMYGNSVSSLYFPFKRFVKCSNPSCKAETAVKTLQLKLNNKKFEWTCPHCKAKNSTGAMDFIDKPDKSDVSSIKLIRWNVKDLDILENPVSKEKIFLWSIPEDFKRKIKDCNPVFINTTNKEIVNAVLEDKKFELDKESCYHMVDEAPAGFRTDGWGLPVVLYNFRQAFYIQMAKMYNEVLMQEYIVPFRVISPPKEGNGPGLDPAMGAAAGNRYNMGAFNRQVARAVDNHRRKPGGYHALPFPVQYQALGGEAAQFAPHEHIDAAMDEFLNALGVPAEFYRGSIGFQALPTALRLFQQSWNSITSQFDGWLNWMAFTVAKVKNWDTPTLNMQPVTLADDIERRMMLFDLMAGQQISPETGLSTLGLDWKEELERRLDNQKEQMNAEMQFEQEMQQEQMMQERFMPQPPIPHGQAGPDGQSPQVTPTDIMAQAEEEAHRLLNMPYEQRRSEMVKLKKADPQLHALVKQQLEEIRGQMSNEGKMMIQEQQGM